MSKTVFFGPFIGEFGWELGSWQGWVRKICADKFTHYRKIASSYEGRAGLYPDVDEFWPVPKYFEIHKPNSVQFLVKGWRNGLPGSKEIHLVMEKSFRKGKVYLDYKEKEMYEASQGPDIEPIANAMLEVFKKQLPPDTILFTPWKYNRLENSNLEFGLLQPEHPLVNIEHPLPKASRLIVKGIPIQNQSIEKLHGMDSSREKLNNIIGPEIKLISLFPRFREHYATRNWTKEKYQQLIVLLQHEFPNHKIAIVGEPGGSYFYDGVPHDTLDLINLDPKNRVSVQIAAMERSLFALGSSSGGLYLANYCGCPVFKWSNPNDPDGLTENDKYTLNPLKISEFVYPNAQPGVDEIFQALIKFVDSILPPR